MNTLEIDLEGTDYSDPKWHMWLSEEAVGLHQSPYQPYAMPLEGTNFLFPDTNRQPIQPPEEPASLDLSPQEPDAQSHEERKTAKYMILSEECKRFLVDKTRYMSISQVARIYEVSINNLRRWRQEGCERRTGPGRNLTDNQLQKKLIAWINEQKQRGVSLTAKSIQEKAKSLSKKQGFKASRGWLRRFITRNMQLGLHDILGISLLKPRKTKRVNMIESTRELLANKAQRAASSESLRALKEAMKKQEDIYEVLVL